MGYRFDETFMIREGVGILVLRCGWWGTNIQIKAFGAIWLPAGTWVVIQFNNNAAVANWTVRLK